MPVCGAIGAVVVAGDGSGVAGTVVFAGGGAIGGVAPAWLVPAAGVDCAAATPLNVNRHAANAAATAFFRIVMIVSKGTVAPFGLVPVP